MRSTCGFSNDSCYIPLSDFQLHAGTNLVLPLSCCFSLRLVETASRKHLLHFFPKKFSLHPAILLLFVTKVLVVCRGHLEWCWSFLLVTKNGQQLFYSATNKTKQNKRRKQVFRKSSTSKLENTKGCKKTKKEFRRLKDLISTGKALYKQRITASGNVITGDWKHNILVFLLWSSRKAIRYHFGRFFTHGENGLWTSIL